MTANANAQCERTLMIIFFRLMLAMDPKYGEISRAMRNRGVEIYILGEVINQNCHFHILDFNSHIFSRDTNFNY